MPTSSFADIANHWAKACIEQLADRDLVKGYPDGTYRPDGTVTRAEFAALMLKVFPEAAPWREFLSFSDVPTGYWAKAAVEWVYQRGFFSGYPDQTFRPDQPIPRVQAIAVLATAFRYPFPSISEETLQQYYDDAIDIPDYAKGAIAISTLKNLVVNYPDVRKLAPNRATTRAEVAAFLCQGLAIANTVPPQYVPWGTQLSDIQSGTTISFEVLRANARLVREIQMRFTALKLYPGGRWLDGKYGPRLETALKEFCEVMKLPNFQSRTLDAKFAQTLLNTPPVTFLLEQAKDRQQIYAEFFQQQSGFSADRLAFLDRGIDNSPYASEIKQYPDRLREIPDDIEVTSLGESLTLTGTSTTVTFAPYPKLGQLPQIDTKTLSFLHPDILSACVCVGSFVDRKLQARWLGKNALVNSELWSSTKMIAPLNMISRFNGSFPDVDADNCQVRPSGSANGYGFYEMALDLVNYKNAIATSNSLAALFKRFETPINLENWLKKATGNTSLTFRGGYGDAPFMQSPQLWDSKSRRVVLSSANVGTGGGNSVSTYDLTRLITMLGWHFHVPLESRIPNAQWDSLECVVRAMGHDSARYLDVAIDRLGLSSVVRSVVVISKLGFGRSRPRDRTELVYTALLQLVDKRPRSENKPAVLRTVAMTLLGAKDLNNANQEALELDARFAAEVTEIVRRIMTQELA